MIIIGMCLDNNNIIKYIILAIDTIPGGVLPSELEKPGFQGYHNVTRCTVLDQAWKSTEKIVFFRNGRCFSPFRMHVAVCIEQIIT